MQRERLTPERIRRFTCPPDVKQAFLWDTEAPRLAVRATSGAKSFVFESKLNRQTIRRTIGDARAWTIDDARAEARRLQTMIDQGTDPRELDREREEAKAAAKAAHEAARREAEERKRYTLRALCDAYVAHLETHGKAKSAAATRSAFKCHVIEAHPKIADTPARDVTAHQVAAVVRKVREAGKERSAGILRSYLSAAFNAARRAPFDASLPADLIAFGVEHNPVEVVATIPVKAGNRTLSADELRAYLLALGDELRDQALRLALLGGGQRLAQLLRARVNDYDERTRTLRLWDAKGKRRDPREHLLPLAPKAAALVETLIERAKTKEAEWAKDGKRPADFTNLWLFSTHGRVAMTETTPGKRAAAICAAMRCEPFDLRDIRRTCETMLAGMGISRETRAQLLSHGISGVQAAHYDRHSYTNEKRTALEAWERHLNAIEKGEKPPANVRQLRRKGKAA